MLIYVLGNCGVGFLLEQELATLSLFVNFVSADKAVVNNLYFLITPRWIIQLCTNDTISVHDFWLNRDFSSCNVSATVSLLSSYRAKQLMLSFFQYRKQPGPER